MRMHEITALTESSWSLSFKYAYRSWYNPATREFVYVQANSTHTRTLVADPTPFGATAEEVEAAIELAKNRPADMGHEEPVKMVAISKGWVRIAGSERNNPSHFMIFEGLDFALCYKALRVFFSDQKGELQNAYLKFGGKEYRLLGNAAVKACVQRKELPEAFTAP